MKKLYIILLLIYLLMVGGVLAGCNKSEKITLSLTYGDRSGTYSGDMLEGVPNGYGKFSTTNSEGTSWTYEGNFKNGHFEGEGKTTWKSGQMEIGTYKDDVIIPMKGDDIKALYTSPEDFKNHCVEIIGRVFNSPEYTNEGVSFQMWGNAENSENNTIVHVYDPEFKVEIDDYIKVTGLVGDIFTGKNALGGEVTAPTIIASEYSILSYQEAIVPTINEITVDQTRTQLGYSVTIQKVEFAEKETRVYVSIENKGSSKFNLYSFNSKITQDVRQFEEQDNWNADYPQIQTDLLVGNVTEGIIAFPPIAQEAFILLLEGSSDNYEETIDDFVFVIGSVDIESRDIRPEVKKVLQEYAAMAYKQSDFWDAVNKGEDLAQYSDVYRLYMDEYTVMEEKLDQFKDYDLTKDEEAYLEDLSKCLGKTED